MAQALPEITFGSNVAVWKNQTQHGITRSITIAPRRYKDGDEWKEAKGFNISDVPMLCVCLSEAVLYCIRQRATEMRQKSAPAAADSNAPTPIPDGLFPNGDLPF